MKRIDRLDGKRECRHCHDDRRKNIGTWSAFFEGCDVRFFDHLSSDKYWFITEPYINQENDVREFGNYVEQNGAYLYWIYPGYHYEEVHTLIVVPNLIQGKGNIARFKDRINKVLDSHDSDDEESGIGFFGGSFNKASVRRAIRDFDPPAREEALLAAMKYLNWQDRKYPYIAIAEKHENEARIAWKQFVRKLTDEAAERQAMDDN